MEIEEEEVIDQEYSNESKQLLFYLQKQMEFYLTDFNLCDD